MSATSIGSIKLHFSINKFILCKDVYYVPDFGKNILSFSKLMKQGFGLNVNKANNAIDIYFKDLFITSVYLINDLFYLKPIYPEIYDTNVIN